MQKLLFTSNRLTLFIRIILGVLFIFSGIVKLVPIEPFELKFVEMGITNWSIAPYLARLLIALELFLGLMLILNIKPKFTCISTISLLFFFTLYLFYEIVQNGNNGNCGCFGTLIMLTPLESIVKNIVMIALLAFLFWKNRIAFEYRLKLFVPLIIVLSLLIPFVIYPLDNVESRLKANSGKLNYSFPHHLIPGFAINGDTIDLKKGEHLLAFMSVNCLHCKKAAYKLYILSNQHQLPPTYLILIGTDDMVVDFKKETKADFPYYLFNEKEFFDIAGNSIPSILYLKEGIVKARFDNVTLTEALLLKALKNTP